MTVDQHDAAQQRADEEALQHARDTRVLKRVLIGAGVLLLVWIVIVFIAFVS